MAKGKGKMANEGSEKSGDDQPGFEQSLERLEEIVAELEGSDVPLERALELFEEGVKLGRTCSTRLDEAERKITVLLEQADGSLVEQATTASAPLAAAPRASKPAPRATKSGRDDDDDSIPF